MDSASLALISVNKMRVPVEKSVIELAKCFQCGGSARHMNIYAIFTVDI